MIRFKDLSIKRKLVIIISTISALGIIISLTIYGLIDILDFKKEIKNTASMSAALVGNYCVAPLLFGYNEEAAEILLKLDALPDVLNACVYDVDNNIFATYNKHKDSEFVFPDTPLKESVFQSKFLHVYHTIIYQNEVYGNLYLRISTAVIREKFLTHVAIMVLLIIVVIIIVYLLAVRLQAIISEPILELADITKEISDNEDYAVQIKTSRKDAIGTLYEQYNKMIKQIRIRQSERDKAELELRKLNEQLEERVKQRTEELENANEELRAAKEAAEAANKAKSVFLSSMSHELRTPMNAILGFSQLLIRDSNLNSSQLHNINTINRSGEHLLSLINDVLEMSKIEAGHIKLKESNFDLYALIDDLELMFRIRTDAKGLLFYIEKSDNLPRYIIADDGKIRQVLINLLGNAIKFTEKGSIKFYAGVVDNKSSDFTLYIDIKDTGIGISDNDVQKVFDYFEQITIHAKQHEGTGLGLAISKQYALLMNGDITVESELGKGSTFRFAFKVKKGKKEDITKYPVNRVTGLKDKYKEFKVLVADDRDTNREVLVNMLKLAGITVREAINGEEAIAAFQSWKPDLILMDMIMPVMDGFEATKQIKSMKGGNDIVIIAITASVLDEDVEIIMKTGTADYIRKPFKEAELFEKIRLHCGVEFRYENDPEFVHVEEMETAKSYKEIKSKVSRIPEELLNDLKKALMNGYRKKLFSLIEQVDKYDVALSLFLLQLTKNYRYDEMMNLLNIDYK